MDEPLSSSPKKKGELLIIDGDPEVGKPCMFGRGIYLYVFYFLCCVKDIYIYVSEEQVLEERYTVLNEKEDIRMDDTREEHWRDVAEDGEDKNNIRALGWEV